MFIDVHLKDRTTGEQRVYHDTFDWKGDVEGIQYMYEDGNYCCDCNRELFFTRAGGEDDKAVDVGCGFARFQVEKIVERGTDNVIYSEAE